MEGEEAVVGTFSSSASRQVTDFYEFERRPFGQQSCASVCEAKIKATNHVRAIKSIPKTLTRQREFDRAKREVTLMQLLDHPNICRLCETFEDNRTFYVAQEMCNGGTLFDRIIEVAHFPEASAAVLMQQIIRVVRFLHEAHICHRDLKPDNFLFATRERLEDIPLKLVDFSEACSFRPGQILTTRTGTACYVAPQVLSGKYDHYCDLWSIGVIMYVLLCGHLPFGGDTEAEALANIRSGNFSFNRQDWGDVSEDAKEFIRGLLRMVPHERLTAEQALNEAWFNSTAPQVNSEILQDTFMDKLRGFNSQNKLKKAALQVLASQLNEGQIRALRETFTALDRNSDGKLTALEMRNGLMTAGHSIPTDFEQIFKDLDINNSGSIAYTEFLAASMDRRNCIQEDICWSIFRRFDTNNDGKISEEELKAALTKERVQDIFNKEALAAVMQQVDLNNDGFIDFPEFLDMMRLEERIVALQINAQSEEGGITATCSAISGDEVGRFTGLAFEEQLSALTALIHEHVQPPAGGRWHLLLPSLQDPEALLDKTVAEVFQIQISQQ